MALPQIETARKTEAAVRKKLESFGLTVTDAKRNSGADFLVTNQLHPDKVARIQVKGRNPGIVKTFRWFQLRVTKVQLKSAHDCGLPPEEAWKKKVRNADFFVLHAVVPEEMWVLSQDQAFELILLNEQQYGDRPDNVFTYVKPFQNKQKEMNLEAHVEGMPIIERFLDCRNNFKPILNFLGISEAGINDLSEIL